MKIEQKNFLTALTANKNEQKTLINNLLDTSIYNIAINKKEIEFEFLKDFTILEKYKLTNDEIFCFECFERFDNAKNALHCFGYLLENKAALTLETYSSQNRLTAKAGITTAATFQKFWATLELDAKNFLQKICKDFYAKEFFDPSFMAYFINGTGGQNFERGQYIKIKDSFYNTAIYTIILQADPQGYIICLEKSGYTILPKNARPQIIEPKDMPNKMKIELDLYFAKYLEQTLDHKSNTIDKAIKIDLKNIAISQKNEKQKEKELLDNQIFNNLDMLQLETESDIMDFVKLFNATTLPKNLKETLRLKAKDAKTMLEPIAPAPAPAGKTRKAAAPAAEPATEPTAIIEPTAKIAGKPRKATAKTAGEPTAK